VSRKDLSIPFALSLSKGERKRLITEPFMLPFDTAQDRLAAQHERLEYLNGTAH
jgi:hypothetical protein